ncbi:MAG TPA: PilT/PilU family type 4a pilus ATPase [Myxococcales bacterium]|nr:PilT/PilU family type 4a pilus ATPase [Myxococcales bacterium]
MSLTQLVTAAKAAQASDLHLEPGLPACVRVRGQLRNLSSDALDARTVLAYAREVVTEEHWADFLQRRSHDVSRTIGTARCRINVLCTARGVGLAIRFLASFQATLAHLNLHPDLARLVQPHNGLVLVSGSTGSGKSTTMAALVQEINERERRHIVTLESPIEYAFSPRQAFIRQREVGRDTPSFEQGLYDSMREDPDVLMVGELRDAETMRLTLNAAETGHLVLTTLHSSTAAEALQRIVSAFPAESQPGVCAQLADCLVGVICQRMRFFPERNLRAPECEVLLATQSAKAIIRQGQFFKLQTALETGGNEGCFTFQRYREWMEKRTTWSAPPPETPAPLQEQLPELAAPKKRAAPAAVATAATVPAQEGVLEIPDGDEDLASLISALEK